MAWKPLKYRKGSMRRLQAGSRSSHRGDIGLRGLHEAAVILGRLAEGLDDQR